MFLKRAVRLAAQSGEEVGCGVVLVRDGKVVAEAYNSQNIDNIAVNHAEIKALTTANRLVKSRKIPGTTAYCSCEPCAMCLAALSYAKVGRIVFYKTMQELFPDDTQSRLDSRAFVKSLNFVPKLEQLTIKE